jgi:ferric-dicitrate binding protein FerR (iron transport regulator)
MRSGFSRTRRSTPGLPPLAGRCAPSIAAFLLVLLALPGAAGAQTRCTSTLTGNPPRQALACPGGFTITPEAGTRYRLIDRNRDGRPEGAVLDEKGLLLDFPAGRPPRDFQILTPHAIASVRGTLWAVDVTAARTSVFVARGTVAVSLPSRTGSVLLGPGNGIDVGAGTTELVVNTWSPARAAALLARFGRQ